ncbi:MerR family transcriptional regulator [Umboniibacter marinipuniceus]|uniref:DNA-binding transcriptional MerR regulator n=1 Tax=Umboniibacter marinipuniceus TaxID=569599 RepID=A0A3M0A918_9GAMM|nr:MerR family DNA-binding transcriptional regulator [Umboniibacter marinipuniceus]RMA79308.1 DNA-binding transcriptional MerR regulator [Umboniibacter marinipuniceus]
MNDFFTISELAQEFDITTRSIRFYEEKGLITPRREGTKRWFSSADRVRLKLILRGKRLGMTLEESAEIINLYNPEDGNRRQRAQLIQQLENRRQQLLAQREDIDLSLRELDQLQQHVEQQQEEE